MGRLLLRTAVIIVALFLVAPIVTIAVVSSRGGPIFAFPPVHFTVLWYGLFPVSYVRALRVSLVVAPCPPLIAVAAGVPAALALVRGKLPIRRTLSALFLSPLT